MDRCTQNPTTCAVAAGLDRMRQALTRQTPPPDAAVEAAGRLRTALGLGLKTGAEWLWLLDGTVLPGPGALAALLDGLERSAGLPPPMLLAGVVVGSDGRVDPERAAWYRRGDPEPAMAAAERRLLPIRATSGPVLVHRRVVEAVTPPARSKLRPGDVLEWTARVIRRAPAAYLVPDSEYVADRAGPDPALEPMTAMRLVAGGAFAGADRLRVAFELAERALRRERAPAS